MRRITHLYCLVIDRVDSVYSRPNTDEYDDSTPSLISIVCGDEEIEWADVMPNTSQSGRSGRRRDRDSERCILEALYRRSKKRYQHICGEDGDIYVLDRACGGTRSKPLPNVFPKFLSNQSHPVHVVRTQCRQSTTNRSMSLFGRRWRNLGYRPVEGTPPFYEEPNQHHYSTPSRPMATNILTEKWKRWALGRRLRWPRPVRVREQ